MSWWPIKRVFSSRTWRFSSNFKMRIMLVQHRSSVQIQFTLLLPWRNIFEILNNVIQWYLSQRHKLDKIHSILLLWAWYKWHIVGTTSLHGRHCSSRPLTLFPSSPQFVEIPSPVQLHQPTHSHSKFQIHKWLWYHEIQPTHSRIFCKHSERHHDSPDPRGRRLKRWKLFRFVSRSTWRAMTTMRRMILFESPSMRSLFEIYDTRWNSLRSGKRCHCRCRRTRAREWYISYQLALSIRIT